MPTRARKRRNFDMGRLREAIRGPGADTRVWIATARIDDDPDALTFDPEIGWIVDVTFYGGPLDQEGPVPCRMGDVFAQQGGTKSNPPGPGCEVLVAITDGDANSNPVIVARMHNAGGCEVPTSVNGDDLTETKALADHIVVTTKGSDEQYGGDRRITAKSLEWEATDDSAKLKAAIDVEIEAQVNAKLSALVDLRLEGLVTATLTSALTRVESAGLLVLASGGGIAMVGPAGEAGGPIALGGTEEVPPTEPAVLGDLLSTALKNYAATLGTGIPGDPVLIGTAAAAATTLTTELAAALSGRVTIE